MTMIKSAAFLATACLAMQVPTASYAQSQRSQGEKLTNKFDKPASNKPLTNKPVGPDQNWPSEMKEAYKSWPTAMQMFYRSMDGTEQRAFWSLSSAQRWDIFRLPPSFRDLVMQEIAGRYTSNGGSGGGYGGGTSSGGSGGGYGGGTSSGGAGGGYGGGTSSGGAGGGYDGGTSSGGAGGGYGGGERSWLDLNSVIDQVGRNHAKNPSIIGENRPVCTARVTDGCVNRGAAKKRKR